MTTASGKTNDEAQIRALVKDWADAIHAKDVDRVAAHFAPDIVTFDLAPPLQYAGAAPLRKSLEAWFPTFHGPVGYEVHDLDVTAGEDVAFCRSLNRITGARTNGEQTDVWVRATVCWRKSQGKWLVVHEHTSVPFYMDGSYKAAIDLKP